MVELRYKGLRLEIPESIYSPSDDTDMLAETLKVARGARVLDMCAGSGVLGLLAARRAREVLLADDDPVAVEAARANALRNGFGNVRVVQSDLFRNVEGTFDLIVFNPPYLPQGEGSEYLELYDETQKRWRNVGFHAWDGGPDGRRIIDRFLETFEPHLASRGRLHMIGSTLSDYARTVEALEGAGFAARVAASRRYFFEEVVVLSAARRSPGPPAGRGRRAQSQAAMPPTKNISRL
ncbi:MAG: methyltransferase [Halobacteria archaeon]